MQLEPLIEIEWEEGSVFQVFLEITSLEVKDTSKKMNKTYLAGI